MGRRYNAAPEPTRAKTIDEVIRESRESPKVDDILGSDFVYDLPQEETISLSSRVWCVVIVLANLFVCGQCLLNTFRGL